MTTQKQRSRSLTKMISTGGRQLLDALRRMPFIDTMELAGILGKPHATVHRRLTSLLVDGIVGRVSHGTAHLPSSRRYYLTARGIREAARILGFDTPSDFVRAYPVSREWLALLIRRMDAVATIYRLAASLSPGVDGLRSHVEFHRRGRFDSTITLYDCRTFGVVRQGLALRRRSLYDRLRAIAEYHYTRRPDTILVLTPSVWEQRLTTRFSMELNLEDSYVGVESQDTLERRNYHVWQKTSGLFSGSYYTLDFVSSQGGTGGALHTESPERKRASIPNPERMVQAAPTSGVSPSEKRILDMVTDHPMMPRDHLACWLGVSEGRISQMMHSLVDTWGLVERRGKRGDTRYTLSAKGIRYITHRDRAQLPTTRGIWSTALTTDHQGRTRQWATASTRRRGRRGTQTASPGSSRSLRPRPGPTLTASCCGRCPPRDPTGPTTGVSRPSPQTPWGRWSRKALRYRSTSSTSCAPVTPKESWLA